MNSVGMFGWRVFEEMEELYNMKIDKIGWEDIVKIHHFVPFVIKEFLNYTVGECLHEIIYAQLLFLPKPSVSNMHNLSAVLLVEIFD